MTLASAYAAIQAGCVAVPQTGYAAIEPPAKYQVTIYEGERRIFYRFNYPLELEWDCPSPPAVVRMYFREHPEVSVSTDPLLTITTFLGACGSFGCFLGTSLWFKTVGLAYHFCGQTPRPCTTIHVQNWKTNVGSIGFAYYLSTPEHPC